MPHSNPQMATFVFTWRYLLCILIHTELYSPWSNCSVFWNISTVFHCLLKTFSSFFSNDFLNELLLYFPYFTSVYRCMLSFASSILNCCAFPALFHVASPAPLALLFLPFATSVSSPCAARGVARWIRMIVKWLWKEKEDISFIYALFLQSFIFSPVC